MAHWLEFFFGDPIICKIVCKIAERRSGTGNVRVNLRKHSIVAMIFLQLTIWYFLNILESLPSISTRIPVINFYVSIGCSHP